MRPKSKQPHPFKDAYHQIAEAFQEVDAQKVLRLRGNIHRRALLIAPAPNDGDFSAGLPLANETYAREFHALMLNHAGLNSEEDFVVMAGSPIVGKKPTKTLIEPFREMLKENQKMFDLIVCIGGSNFKFYFGRGKKSSLQTLSSGTPVFLTFDWPSLPIFVLPDIEALSPQWTNNRDIDWKLERVQEACHGWLERIMPGLQKTYKRYVK